MNTVDVAGLCPSLFVRHQSVDGLVVILDLGTSAYHILDEVASAMWQLIVQCPRDRCSILEELKDQFDVESGRLARDFDAFLRTCIDKQLLSTAHDVKPRTILAPAHVSIPFWHAWRCMLHASVTLRRRGLGATYLYYARLASRRDDTSAEGLDRALATFKSAENFWLFRRAPNDCLPRSLALFRFLRDLGFAADHCIGVHRYPFHAHAWVEYQGNVVLDVDRRSTHTTLARIV
jgi:hypothetical protein